MSRVWLIAKTAKEKSYMSVWSKCLLLHSCANNILCVEEKKVGIICTAIHPFVGSTQFCYVIMERLFTPIYHGLHASQLKLVEYCALDFKFGI